MEDGSYSRNVVRRLCVVCSVETERLNRLGANSQIIKPGRSRLQVEKSDPVFPININSQCDCFREKDCIADVRICAFSPMLSLVIRPSLESAIILH